MLEDRLKATIQIASVQHFEGRPCYIAELISDDNKILHIYEGQLKYIDFEPAEGAKYDVVFEPFVNNRWVELRIIRMLPVDE